MIVKQFDDEADQVTFPTKNVQPSAKGVYLSMAGKRCEFETENMTFTTVLEPLHDKEDQYGGGGFLSIVVAVAFMPPGP